MLNQQIIDFIKAAKASGQEKDAIAKTLISNGWTIPDINSAFALVEGEPLPMSAPVVAGMPPPTQTTPASLPTMPASTAAYPAPRGHKSRAIFGIIGAILLLGFLVGTAYAYIQKIGPFSQAPYSEENLLSGLLAKVGQIQTSSYQVSASLSVEPRDANAKPFVATVSNQAALEKQYKNDAQRARDLEELLYELKFTKGALPATLQQLIQNKGQLRYYSLVSINDPLTKQPYEYTVTNNGADFALSANFETDEAIRSVRNGYGYAATTTVISGKKVTFTKKSSMPYLSAEPPQPFFIQLQEMASWLPAQLKASLSVGATTDWSKSDADWKFTMDASGDFGDLTYKLNADALKKDAVYYFRINNIPSILGSLSSYKGVWIKVDPQAATSTYSYSFDELSYAASQLPDLEDSYKENRTEAADLLSKAVTIADEEGLLVFKETPSAERVDGRLLYRYDVQFNKAAILPFYKRLIAEADKTSSHSPFVDEGLVEYLQSKEFDEVFAYYEDNTALTLWADPQGYPARIQYSLRFVPADTATALTGKQAKLIFDLVLSDVNVPVEIEAPEGAKTVQEAIGTSGSSPLGTARAKSQDASIQSTLSSIRVQAEIYYSKNNTYGTASASCTAKVGMFSDATIKEQLVSAGKANSSSGLVCNNTAQAYAVAAKLVAPSSTTYYCVDSTGAAGTVTTPLGKSTACPSE